MTDIGDAGKSKDRLAQDGEAVESASELISPDVPEDGPEAMDTDAIEVEELEWQLPDDFDEEPEEEKKPSSGGSRSVYVTDFGKGDKVYFWDAGAKRHATIIEKRGDMYALDVENSSITQVRQKWALTLVERAKETKVVTPSQLKKEAGSTYQKTPPAPKSQPTKTVYDEHLPLPSDKNDVITRPDKPLPFK